LKSKKDRVYFLVKRNTEPIGVIDLTNINYADKSAEIGLYAKPQLKGIGNHLMETIINYAVYNLKLKTLFAEVFTENTAAIKLYKRYNFKTYDKKEMGNRQIQLMELQLENR
jgi:UDP-4-amino-4,6-dideoxy-N-acetyl-beta-L-altrosamine N-acetyltransferase